MKYIIKKPIFSEKSLAETESKKYTFEVEAKANKHQIRSAIEKAFNVNVLDIKTRIIHGKQKRNFRTRTAYSLSDKKIATVLVKKDQKIDIFERKEK